MSTTKEGIKQAIAQLKAADKSNTARFAVVTATGVDMGGTACHGRLSSIQGKPEVVVTAIDQPSYVQRKIVPPTYVDDYSLWLSTKSVFAPCFLGIEDGFYLIDANQPSNFMAAACVATRMAYERFGGHARTILALVKAGVPDNMAHYLANRCTYSQTMSSGLKVGFSRGLEDHQCMEVTYFKEGCLKNLLEGKPTNLNAPYSSNVAYHGIYKLFMSYPPATYSAPTSFHKKVGEILSKNAEGSNSVNTNPFPVALEADGPKMYDHDVAVQAMIKSIPQIMEVVYGK